METIIYQNKWCKIVNIGTYYVVKSKAGKYNDQYFLSADQAYKCIGINMFNHNFSK